MSLPSPGSRRAATALTLLVAAALLAGLWLSGAFAALGAWALDQQRALQGQLAQTIQAIRAGEAAAIWSLLALSAAYGFVHALGPGHGKVLVTGAAFGTTASAARMSLIALAGSLGQALVAILLVYGGLALFQATSRQAAGLDTALEPVGHLAVALVGVWLIARGLRSTSRAAGSCACGHHHAPDPSAASASLRETAALVAAMAARPCAVIAMGLGTAAFTVTVAILAVCGREAALSSAGSALGSARLRAAVQVAAGAVILLLSGALLHASLGS